MARDPKSVLTGKGRNPVALVFMLFLGFNCLSALFTGKMYGLLGYWKRPITEAMTYAEYPQAYKWALIIQLLLLAYFAFDAWRKVTAGK